MEFKTVNKILDAAINLNEDEAWFFSVDNGVKEEVIRLNTIDQLFDRGVDSLNKSLGDYAPYTVEDKKRKGQKHSNITLKNKGNFYKTFRVEVTVDKIKISANPIKDNDNLFDDFGVEIVGLTTENTKRISELILKNIIIYVKKELAI